tara:strand:+ start:586 stop:1656 length:1071 start_codon:yes stop_codon:yes gene_type:complete
MRDDYLSPQEKEEERKLNADKMRQQGIALRTPTGSSDATRAIEDAFALSQGATAGDAEWKEKDKYYGKGGLGFLLAPIMNKITGAEGKRQGRRDSNTGRLTQALALQRAKQDDTNKNEGFKSYRDHQDALKLGDQKIGAEQNASKLVADAKLKADETEQGYKVDLKLQDLGNKLAVGATENQYAIEDDARAEVGVISTEQREIAQKKKELDTKKLDMLRSRQRELMRELPSLARMAGENTVNADGTIEEGRGEFAQFFGGSGAIAGMLPMFSDDGQALTRLASSEALKTLSLLDTPLTPVSDKDMEVVMATGISAKNNESVNYKLATDALAAIEKEIELRTANKLPEGVKSITRVL